MDSTEILLTIAAILYALTIFTVSNTPGLFGFTDFLQFALGGTFWYFLVIKHRKNRELTKLVKKLRANGFTEASK